MRIPLWELSGGSKNVVASISIDPYKISEKEMSYKWLGKFSEYDVCDKCLEKLEKTIEKECEVKS